MSIGDDEELFGDEGDENVVNEQQFKHGRQPVSYLNALKT